MNDILKQRLVGAMILVALGVVFWPIVFVEPEEKSIVVRQSIPEPPAVSTEDIEAPDPGALRPSPELAANDDAQAMDEPVENILDSNLHSDGGGVSSVEAAEALTQSDRNADTAGPRTEAPQKLAMDGDGVPIAWTLQVATVSSAENAEALRRRLLEKHEKAYVTTVSSGGKQLYRVFVGPKFERVELEKRQASINAEFGVKTMLVRYLP